MKTLIKGLLIILFWACNNTNTDQKRVVWNITDFHEKKSITLKPDSTVAYSSIVIKVKGHTQDTIIIKRDEGYYDIKLSGKIDTIIPLDYYGSYNQFFEFDPYLNKSGDLHITIDMY